MIKVKDKVQIAIENKQVYATIDVITSLSHIESLITLIMFEVVILILIIPKLPIDDFLFKSIPILVIAFFLIGFSIKYLLWKSYGVEKLVVGRQMIQWSFHYGVFGRQLNEVDYDILTIGYECTRCINDCEEGRLIFYSSKNESEPKRQIHKTTVPMTKKQAKKINAKIWSVLGLKHKVLE